MGREEVERKILESVKEIFDVAKEYTDFDVVNIGIVKYENGGYIVTVNNDHWNEGVKTINFGTSSDTWVRREIDYDATTEG